MALDHGSELHMLRYLGRHRNRLDSAVRSVLKDEGIALTCDIEWLDFPFDAKAPQKDAEWKGVDFLADAGGPAWKAFWPDPQAGVLTRSGAPSWDAVGRISHNGKSEWLLVEAKAHLKELRNPSARCGAKGASLNLIKKSLMRTWTEYSAPESPSWAALEAVWLGKDYQKANRLACLHFLNQIHKSPARLLYVYFTGDSFSDAPIHAAGWQDEIAAQYGAMGLSEAAVARVHEIFLSVDGRTDASGAPHQTEGT